MNVLTTPIDIFEDANPEVLKFNFDPLALSCCLHRTRNEHRMFSFSGITDNALAEHLNFDDKMQADVIRDYYNKKYFWRQLQNNYPLSAFRRTALDFINSNNPREIPFDLVKIIHKLPEFYNEDLILDSVKKGADLHFKDSSTMLTRTKVLTPKNSYHRRSKREKQNYYWLWDEHNRLCNISVEPNNSLEHLWLDIFNNSSKIKIHGYFFTKERDNFKYYTVSNWTLEK